MVTLNLLQIFGQRFLNLYDHCYETNDFYFMNLCFVIMVKRRGNSLWKMLLFFLLNVVSKLALLLENGHETKQP